VVVVASWVEVAGLGRGDEGLGVGDEGLGAGRGVGDEGLIPQVFATVITNLCIF
jgi:hypothetical protein